MAGKSDNGIESSDDDLGEGDTESVIAGYQVIADKKNYFAKRCGRGGWSPGPPG